MNPIRFDEGLYGRLRAEAGSHWQAYIAHPFVNQLAAGSLPEAAFRRYLTQDYLFLIQFARAYALLTYKLSSLAQMRAATAALEGIVAELPLHVGYCAGWGMTEEGMSSQPEAMETLNYTRYVLDIGQSGDALDLLVAMMPCVAGYAEIGLRLLNNPATVMGGNPYASWISNYGNEAYLNSVQTSLTLLEQIGRERGGEGRFAALSAIFTTATRLESAFWQMGLNASEGLESVAADLR